MLLSKLSLSRKLAVVFAAISIIAAVTLSMLHLRVDEMDEAERTIIHTFEVVVAAEKSSTAMSNAQSATRAYLLTGDAQFADLYKRWGDDLAKVVAEMRQGVHNPAQVRRLDELVRAGDDWRRVADKAFQLMGSPDTRQDALKVVTSGEDRAAMERFRAAAQEIRDGENELLKAREAVGDAAGNSGRLFAIGGGILVVLTAIAAGFLLYSDVGGPIIAMTDAMRQAWPAASCRSRSPARAASTRSAPWPRPSACSGTMPPSASALPRPHRPISTRRHIARLMSEADRQFPRHDRQGDADLPA